MWHAVSSAIRLGLHVSAAYAHTRFALASIESSLSTRVRNCAAFMKLLAWGHLPFLLKQPQPPLQLHPYQKQTLHLAPVGLQQVKTLPMPLKKSIRLANGSREPSNEEHWSPCLLRTSCRISFLPTLLLPFESRSWRLPSAHIVLG